MTTDDFFRSRLDQMIDLRHPLAVLAQRLPWAQIEAALAPALAHKDRTGTVVGDVDLFGPSAQLVGAGVSAPAATQTAPLMATQTAPLWPR